MIKINYEEHICMLLTLKERGTRTFNQLYNDIGFCKYMRRYPMPPTIQGIRNFIEAGLASGYVGENRDGSYYLTETGKEYIQLQKHLFGHKHDRHQIY